MMSQANQREVVCGDGHGTIMAWPSPALLDRQLSLSSLIELCTTFFEVRALHNILASSYSPNYLAIFSLIPLSIRKSSF
jgi:hypothetical protein